MNISPLVKLSPTVSNQVTVSWAADYGRRYAIAIYLVKKLSSSDLLSRMKNRGVKHSDYTRGLSKYIACGWTNLVDNCKIFLIVIFPVKLKKS